LPAARDQVISREIDVGNVLFVCPIKIQAEIRAVFCGDDITACIAIADIADADVAKLKAATASELLLQKACG
jgi:hypothetical protein